MSSNPMEEQVGRVVGNVLAAGGEIFLPEVGSLCVERRRAQRLSRRSVRPPYRAVTFTPQRRGVSLVEEIARVLTASGMSEAEAPQAAQEVYGRWLERVREGETLTVCGVGVLKQDRFTLDEAFDRRLNPQGHAPVKVRSAGRPDWVIWIGAAAVAAAVGIGGYSYLTTRPERSVAVSADRNPSAGVAGDAAVGQETVAAGTAGNASGASASDTGAATAGKTAGTDSGAAGAAVTARQTVRTESRPASRPAGTEPASMTSKRSYVVLGVFSTPENAARAARNAASGDVAVTCGVYRFGAKFMVSPFESDDPEACALFIRAHAERFPGMWTYTAR
ncbi:hypothetical protein ACF3NQ_06135 [Alistipes dispar]|uniref:hypothetical protein n=1 Tax=Alistipes dispar TaxID=2585119 RepID=UPI003BF3C9A8